MSNPEMTGRVGLLLVVIPLGCFGSWIWWDQTRAWVPLDEPVSFDQGRSVTAEFEINVAGRYAIAMVTGHDYCFVNPCDVGVPDLHLSWVVSKGRGVVSKGTSLPDGGAGRYGWPRRDAARHRAAHRDGTTTHSRWRVDRVVGFELA